MNNVLTVAVCNRLQDLLHDHGGITLAVVGPLDDLVKELSTRAQLSDNEVTFFILVCFIELNNVRVVHCFEDIDLRLKEFLFVFVHHIFLNYFDGAYFTCFLRHALSNFTKRSLSEHIINLVIIADIIVVREVVKHEVLFI